MGLDTTHDCFHGAYSAFNRFRQYIAKGCGGSFPPHDPEFRDDDENKPLPGHWYYEPKIVPEEHREGMTLFLGHSDCDGIFTPQEAIKVAKFLRWVAPRVQAVEWGHIQGPVDARILKFAEGCELAASRNENVEFG